MTSCILTASGKWFDVLNPSPDLIELADIACALSKLCRFGGHCREFYSVAEHSIFVSRLIAQRGGNAASVTWGLLHDASEAYVVDIPRPVKRQIPQYVAIEDKVQSAVAKRFSLPWPMPEEAHVADHDILAWELREYMPAQTQQALPAVPNDAIPARVQNSPLIPKMAELAFLHEARRLGLLSG